MSSTAARAPGRYEDFLRAVVEPSAMSPDDEANLAVLAGANRITVLAEPGDLPA